MAEHIFRSELSPNTLAYKGHATLPDAEADLITPISMIGDTTRDKIGAMEIYFSASVGGTLSLKRTVGEVSVLETMNFGNVCVANQPVGPQIVTFASGETISFIYSATGGTYYLTLCDVSGDYVRQVK